MSNQMATDIGGARATDGRHLRVWRTDSEIIFTVHGPGSAVADVQLTAELDVDAAGKLGRAFAEAQRDLFISLNGGTPPAPYGDDEDEDDGTETVRAKWILDGAETLAEAADRAREFADWLQGLHTEGYVLDGPVADDYGHYYKPGAAE
jgi:hypothetical protein